MPDWMNSRLLVRAKPSVGGAYEDVTPIDSFTPTFNLNTEVIHSIEQTHVGYVANPDSFTFSISVRAIGPSAAKLTRYAMEGTRFDITTGEQTGSTGEWSLDEVLLKECLITSANPSNATINGAPAATFSGVCLSTKVTDTTGDLELPAF
jgi:hypothetical protein